MQPFLKYVGGKRKEMKYIKNHIPEKFNTYIEPFFGGGAIYFHLQPEKAIINDINTRLINCYLDVRNNFDEMYNKLSVIDKEYKEKRLTYLKTIQGLSKAESKNVVDGSQELFYLFRDRFNNPTNDINDSVTYFFINKTTYRGRIRYNRHGKFNGSFGFEDRIRIEDLTKEHSLLLNKADIYNIDYKDIMKMATPEDFIFLDPPYDCGFTSYGNMENDFTTYNHEELAKIFKNLKCKALMVIGKSPVIDNLYKNYIVDEYLKKYLSNCKGAVNTSNTHYIVKNYK